MQLTNLINSKFLLQNVQNYRNINIRTSKSLLPLASQFVQTHNNYNSKSLIKTTRSDKLLPILCRQQLQTFFSKRSKTNPLDKKDDASKKAEIEDVFRNVNFSLSAKKSSFWKRSDFLKTVSRAVNICGAVFLIYVGYIVYDSVQKLEKGNSESSSASTGNSDLGNSVGMINAKSHNWTFVRQIYTSFDDVLGCDEVKNELYQVVEYLKKREKFAKMGATLPKGVLLEGPPGVGKTLLARAVAGEAHVPFIYVSGAEFDEVYVGMGARKLRDLFQEAKRNSPCIIFIDELDACGAKRSTSTNHPYANQTINQLLSEMDGFVSNEGIIVLAATNKKSLLDEALIRPGRFDSVLHVPKPDFNGRLDLLIYYCNRVARDSKLDLDAIARRATGLTGADIKNLVNTAAISAVRENDDKITMQHLWNAYDKLVMGPARLRHLDEKVNYVTACHEAGHALVGYYNPSGMALHKATIISRGDSLGHTSFVPEGEMHNWTKSQLLGTLDRAMGGRVAEEVMLGGNDVTIGAHSDFQSASNIAESMILHYGMSEKLGCRIMDKADQLSSETKIELDREVARLLKESYNRAKEIIVSHQQEHKALTEALLKYKTLDRDEIEMVIKSRNSNLPSKQRPKENKMAAAKNIVDKNNIPSKNSSAKPK